MLEHHRFQIEQSQNSQSTQKASSNEVEELKLVNTIVQNISSNDFEQLANQLNTITRRLDRMEEQMQDKANDVVTYQLLQHRRNGGNVRANSKVRSCPNERRTHLYYSGFKTNI